MIYCKRILYLTAAFVLSLFQLQLEAEARRKNYVKTPVFFITDRKFDGERFGPHRKYEVDCKHDPYLGKAFPVVLNEKEKEIDTWREQLGWSVAKKPKKRQICEKEVVEAKSFAVAQEKFYEELLDAARKDPEHDLYVFVHGFKTKFQAAAREAGELAYYSECPVLLYSWPSVGKLTSYNSDQENSEWSQEHFNNMIQQLTALGEKDLDLKIHLVGYSMGTRLVVRSAPYLAEKGVFKEYVLVCPDIDMGIFRHYLYKYASANGTAAIRVYNSRQDKALVLSQMLHGGYLRFGEYTDSLFDQFVSWMDDDNDDKSHGVYDETSSERDQILEEARKRIQTIEFTRIDKGFIGHKLPCELICNMAATGKPGPELELVQAGQETGSTNRFGRFISWWTEIANPHGKVDDTCLYVTRVSDKERESLAVKTEGASSK
jgi:pimeloyl-ACP methyl ester carboxylesterase